MDLEFIGDSDAIAAAGFNMVSKDLQIQFTDGSTYTYHNVDPLVWYNFLRVTSKGWFYNKYIRNRYSFS